MEDKETVEVRVEEGSADVVFKEEYKEYEEGYIVTDENGVYDKRWKLEPGKGFLVSKGTPFKCYRGVQFFTPLFSDVRVFRCRCFGYSAEHLCNPAENAYQGIYVVKELSSFEWLSMVNEGTENTGRFNLGNKNCGSHNVGSFNVGHHNVGWFNVGNHNIGWFNTESFKSGCWFNRMLGSEAVAQGFTFPTFKAEKFLPEFLLDVHLWKIAGNSVVTADRGNVFKESLYKLIKERPEEEVKAERNKLTALPNFDWEVFEKITGIKESDFDLKPGDIAEEKVRNGDQ